MGEKEAERPKVGLFSEEKCVREAGKRHTNLIQR